MRNQPRNIRPTSPRDTCATCHRKVHVRRDGLLRLHRNKAGAHCDGSHRKPGTHTCRGCEDRWAETRGADSINTVRWPGWFA